MWDQWRRLGSAGQFFWFWLGLPIGPMSADCQLEPCGTLATRFPSSSRLAKTCSHRHGRVQVLPSFRFLSHLLSSQWSKPITWQGKNQGMDSNPPRVGVGRFCWVTHQSEGTKAEWRFGALHPSIAGIYSILENHIIVPLSTRFVSTIVHHIFQSEKRKKLLFPLWNKSGAEETKEDYFED